MLLSLTRYRLTGMLPVSESAIDADSCVDRKSYSDLTGPSISLAGPTLTQACEGNASSFRVLAALFRALAALFRAP